MKKRYMASLAAAAVALLPATASASTSGTDDVRLSYRVPSGESGNVALDGSTYHNNGSLRGGVTRSKGSYKFHRLSADHHFDRIHAHDSPSLSPGINPFSFGLRLKVRPTAEWENNEMAVIRHGDSDTTGGNYKMELRKTPNGTVAVECVIHDADRQGSGYVRSALGVTLNDGHWHTVTCARDDATTVSLTIGHHVLKRPVHGTLDDVTGKAPFLLGYQQGAHRIGKREQFVGRMDNIHVTVH
jgi:hypothetical protein